MKKYDSFIYGRHQGSGITGLVQSGNIMELWRDDKCTPYEGKSIEWYILYSEPQNDDCFRLDGDLQYKWCQKFATKEDYNKALGMAKGLAIDHFTIYNPIEAFMIKEGVTMYKGMAPKDVSVLSFDIEATGLDPKTNKVLMIANTFRDNKGRIFRNLFSIDDYKSEKEMIYAWCSYVVNINPSIIVGHNIFSYDLPFLTRRLGKNLPIGKMSRPAKTATRSSEFRKDGSQSYTYFNCIVPGREIVDTFHLAIKYDTGRSYPSYGLKSIIKFEGLEVKDRQHWDFANGIPTPDHKDWDMFKKYAEHDSDDALTLYDLMIPSYFYYAQHIPKTLQQIVNGAAGSQINAFMIRAYLNDRHSIPSPSDPVPYEGAISFGNPGIYKYVGKYDVASLYPSIILQEQIYDQYKDPKRYFLKMVEYFTKERLNNKSLAKSSGDRYYKDLEQSQKIVINSAYGFLGATGLNFNSPYNAARITRSGREILKKGLDWANKKNFTIVNADTDSFSFTPGHKFPPGAYNEWLKELNSNFPEKIKWEDDGTYTSVIVVKAKNYILEEAKTGKVKIKGSALKATMKEPALQKFIDDVIKALLEGRKDELESIYYSYIRAIGDISMESIAEWCSKKTITKAVLTPKRTNEQRLLDSIKQAKISVQEGDKIFVYFKTKTELGIRETYDGEIDKRKLYEKLFKTAKIFESVIDIKLFPNMALKKNAKLLDGINKNSPPQIRETEPRTG